MNDVPTIFFAGGGTGGHLFPGLAVVEELQRRTPVEVVFLGSEREIERAILLQHGCQHRPLGVLPSSQWRRPLRFLFRLWQAYRQSRRLIREHAPQVVVGLGGFASVPVVSAAARAGIPVVLLEQNAVAGRATCALSRFARLICLSFEETAGRLSPRAHQVVTGNPVRREISALHRSRSAAESDARQFLVLGGSQGAHAVNELVLRFAEGHRSALDGWRIVHQTGAADCESVASRWNSILSGKPAQAVVQPFFDDLPGLSRQSAFVVSRAGATSLAEFACAGLGAILVPYPHSLGDHQRANALRYESAGAAIVVEQNQDGELAQERFNAAMLTLLSDSSRRALLREMMWNSARPDAAERVASLLRPMLQHPPHP